MKTLAKIKADPADPAAVKDTSKIKKDIKSPPMEKVKDVAPAKSLGDKIASDIMKKLPESVQDIIGQLDEMKFLAGGEANRLIQRHAGHLDANNPDHHAAIAQAVSKGAFGGKRVKAIAPAGGGLHLAVD